MVYTWNHGMRDFNPYTFSTKDFRESRNSNDTKKIDDIDI